MCVGSTKAATPAAAPAHRLQIAHGHRHLFKVNTGMTSTLQQHQHPISELHTATHLAAAPCSGTSHSTQAPKRTRPNIWQQYYAAAPAPGSKAHRP